MGEELEKAVGNKVAFIIVKVKSIYFKNFERHTMYNEEN